MVCSHLLTKNPDDLDEPQNEACDAEQADAEQAEQPEQEQGLEQQESTQKAFNALRGKYKSTHDFVIKLFAEPLLQRRTRILVDFSADLHEEYANHLAQESLGQEAMLQWAVDRANGKWHVTIIKIINRLLSSNTARRLGCTRPTYQKATQFDPANNDDHKVEALLLKESASLALALASNRAWSQAMFGLVFPYCLARIMSQDEPVQQRAQRLLRSLAQAVHELQQCSKANPGHEDLERLLEDVSTHTWVVTKEIIQHGNACDWNPDDSELRSMGWSLFAGPSTTKNVLESVIGAVKDASERFSKNNRQMSGATKWCYTATASCANTGGMKQITLSQADFQEFSQLGGTDAGFHSEKAFSPLKPKQGSQSVTNIIPTPQQIRHEIRKAGHHTNRRATAAMAFLIKYSSDRSFCELVSHAWTGTESVQIPNDKCPISNNIRLGALSDSTN